MMVHDTQPGTSNSMAFDIVCKSSEANWNFAVTPTNAAAHLRGYGYTPTASAVTKCISISSRTNNNWCSSNCPSFCPKGMCRCSTAGRAPNAWYENSYIPNSAWGIPTGDAVSRRWADLLKNEGALGVWMTGHKYNLYRIGPSFAGLCTCEAGKAFSALGNAPCTTCKDVTACAQGVKTSCTTTTDTVCNVSSPHPITNTVVSVGLDAKFRLRVRNTY